MTPRCGSSPTSLAPRLTAASTPIVKCCSSRPVRRCAVGPITVRSCIWGLSALRHAERDLGDRATLMRTDTYTEALEQYGRPVLVYEPTSCPRPPSRYPASRTPRGRLY